MPTPPTAKDPAAVPRLAGRAAIAGKGRAAWSGASQALRNAPMVREAHLHV